ncbi:MAG: tRNA-dihydrouridine synthase, partial [Lachnospiraceae bacterium]|nr:tRNA-dihydrouridine synthase [Lachnospiraceae bacterium]
MIYFAPLEDISGYILRNLINSMFPGSDRYFAPFISAVKPGMKHKKRETEDIAPENNDRTQLIPQILANDPDSFLNTAKWLIEKGYNEINLNLGCPSRDVVARGKGSGFL